MERRRTNRVLVIGAQGVMGTLTAGAFATAGWTVRAGARRPGPGQVPIDLDSAQSIAAAFTEDELVVNTVPHPELLAERHVLELAVALAGAPEVKAQRRVAGPS